MAILQKSLKDDLKSLGEHADLASNAFSYTQNDKKVNHPAHISWLANALKKEPMTPEAKANIEHFTGAYDTMPGLKSVNLQGKSLSEGLKALNDQYQKAMTGGSIVSKKGEVVSPGNGKRNWWNLGVAGCAEEGKAGKHCGNTPALSPNSGKSHEKVISLRENTNDPNKLHQHLTFVSNDGHLTEGKGRANTKPKSSYHPDIVNLLAQPWVKSYIGGGYLPGSNFDPEDVTDPDLKTKLAEIQKKKPNLFSPDVSELHPSVQNDPFLNFTVTNKPKYNQSESQGKYDHNAVTKKILEDPESHKTLAQNPNLSPEHQKMLLESNGPGSWVHRHLAENPNLSNEFEPMRDSLEKHLIQKIRDADENDPDSVEQAQYAAENLQKIRKARLIGKLKTSQDPNFLKKYEFSHNEEVAAEAQKSLKGVKKFKPAKGLKLIRAVKR